MDRIDYDKPATTDAERKALAAAWARDQSAMDIIRTAARMLINDVRRRHPGEELTCPYMRFLDEVLEAEFEIDKKVVRNLYTDQPGVAERLIRFVESFAGERRSKLGSKSDRR